MARRTKRKRPRPKVKIPPQPERWAWLRSAAVPLFGNLADRYSHLFGPLRTALVQADMRILLRSYLAIMFMLTALSYVAALAITTMMSFLLPSLPALLMIVFVPLLVAASMLLALYAWPLARARSRAANIEANLPFALAHMAAIAGSGVPASVMFRILARFREYGEVSREAADIVRAMDVFGLSELAAIRHVAMTTPSKPLKELLFGLLMLVQTGGSLTAYLKQAADSALFSYRLNRERYMQLLSTYADIYTAVLVAAPLFMIAVLAILNILGGQLFGMPIQTIMALGIFIVIPVLNVIFLAFLHATQPPM
jgi:archaellum biogenesis protein FlaJ (TadC family)